MFDKLREVEGRYEEIQQRLCDPGVVSDVEEYTRLMKESKSLLPVVEKYREYRQAEQTAAEAKALLASYKDRMTPMQQRQFTLMLQGYDETASL